MKRMFFGIIGITLMASSAIAVDDKVVQGIKIYVRKSNSSHDLSSTEVIIASPFIKFDTFKALVATRFHIPIQSFTLNLTQPECLNATICCDQTPEKTLAELDITSKSTIVLTNKPTP